MPDIAEGFRERKEDNADARWRTEWREQKHREGNSKGGLVWRSRPPHIKEAVGMEGHLCYCPTGEPYVGVAEQSAMLLRRIKASSIRCHRNGI